MRIRIDPLDTKFSKLIRAWHPICECCNQNSSTQVHHFKGRRYQSVRYLPENVLALCFSCHRKFHEDPIFAVDFMKKRLGDKYDSFVLRANAICKRYSEGKKLLGLWIGQELNKINK